MYISKSLEVSNPYELRQFAVLQIQQGIYDVENKQLQNKQRNYLWSNRHFRTAKLLYSWISIVPCSWEKDYHQLQGRVYILPQHTQVGVCRFIPQTSDVGITNLDPHLRSNFSHHACKFIGKTCVTRRMDDHPLHQIHLQHDKVSRRVKALAVNNATKMCAI